MNDTISGRMDMLNSINTALQNLSARPAESKPYRISDLIPRNWEGSNEKGELRSFMSDLHLWMQAWSDQGEQMLAIVEKADKLDNNAIAFDCSDDEFRSIDASHYQVLHRTTANEPLRIVQQTRGRRGFEAWLATVRRYDQRNTSDKNSAYAAMISNISEKDRAKDVAQFVDILRTFTNAMNKFENRFGKIRDACSQETDARKLAELQVLMDDDVVQCSHCCAGEQHRRQGCDSSDSQKQET